MASTFAAPNADLNVPHYHNSYYGPNFPNQSQHTQSPPSSTSESSTPPGISPTSPTVRTQPISALPPHILYQSRQLRPPKSPLYVPAALRPTEPPNKHSPPKHGLKAMGKSQSSPPTPPHSAEGDVDNAETLKRLLGDGLAKHSMTRIVTDEWKDLEDVKGAPTREHWKPDSSTSTCDLADCPTAFTTFKRRHHCRRCGNIFCGPHASHQVPLDQHARFHPDGQPARACECCWNDFKMWKMARQHRQGSKSSSSNDSGNSTPIAEGSSNRPSMPAPSLGPGDGTGRGSGEMAVGSLPRDWNWSTF